jgi:hypothetical protein
MLTALLAAVVLSAPAPQAQAAAPPAPATPAACVAASRELRTTRATELASAGGMTAEISRTIEQERQALLRSCLARFDLAQTTDRDLAGLAALYAEANQPEQAKAVVGRALAAQGLSPESRAEVLVQAVSIGLREPKGDERNARLEHYVDELDRLPGAFDQQFNAHSRMNGYYRADDIDAGIVKHSAWIIDQAARFDADQRKKYGSTVANAFVNLAQARAGQNQNDQALALLRRALAEWGDLPATSAMVQPELERYLLVGTTGAPITAPRWLNGPENSKTLDPEGKVTLLEFSAHWCGPCRESYPGINRLRARFAGTDFQVVLATQLYGFFQSERPLAAETEVERDKAYFAGHHLDVPIAIGDKVDIKVENGRTVYLPAPNPNDTAYKVSGIPQIQILDRRGRIRLIMVGYDDANEAKLGELIERLIKEK